MTEARGFEPRGGRRGAMGGAWSGFLAQTQQIELLYYSMGGCALCHPQLSFLCHITNKILKLFALHLNIANALNNINKQKKHIWFPYNCHASFSVYFSTGLIVKGFCYVTVGKPQTMLAKLFLFAPPTIQLLSPSFLCLSLPVYKLN